MKFIIGAVFVCLVAVVFTFQLPNVLKFVPHHLAVDSDMQDLMELLGKDHLPERYKPDEVFRRYGLDPSTKVMTFSFKNCGDTKEELMIVKDLKVSPDPLKIGGNFQVSFDVEFTKTVSTPIQANVTLYKKIAGQHFKIPCVGNIGSCIYSDVCDLLGQITACPAPFVKSGVPCKCPFKKGDYQVQGAQFSLPSLPIPTGDYSAVANMTRNGRSVGCYEIQLSFE